MTDLVTGAEGFVGVHLVEALRAAGRDVTLATRAMGDGREAGALCNLIGEGGFERVFHLAALSRTGVAEKDPALALRVNRDWAGELAGAARLAGARFVHVSTDLVFGAVAPGPLGFGVSDAVAPLGVYGASKAAGEAAVLEADPSGLVVRLPLLFGDSGGRGLGASDALFAALRRGESPMLFTDEWRTPLDVEAMAKCLVLLAGGSLCGAGGTRVSGDQIVSSQEQVPADSFARGIHHLAGRAVNRFELGQALCLAAGVDASKLRPGTRADCGLAETRASNACLDPSVTLAVVPELRALLDSGSAPEMAL